MTLLEQMARAYETWMPLQLHEWYTADERRELAMEEMRPQAEHTANAEFGAGFRDHLQPLGGPDVPDPLAWANRRVEFADGNWCIAGIRFLGLDTRKPFVHVVATSVPPQHDRLGTYATQLHREFADFGPLAIRFELPHPPEDADIDQWIIAGLVSELRRKPRRPQHERVRLTPADPSETAPYADEVLGNVARQRPEVRTWTEAATPEQLQSCAETGALCAIEVDGQRAGIIAAARDDANGMRGFQVYEFLLDDNARGRGLAPVAMQLLCDVLPAHTGDTLWGMVHVGNGPSIGNALAVGREKTAAFVWVQRRGELYRVHANEGLSEKDAAMLAELGIGFTNLVNRMTPKASDLTKEELVAGGEVVRSVVEKHQPTAVMFAGIGAYREAYRRPKATRGLQPETLAGVPVWVVGNPSGLNVHETVATLAESYREVWVLRPASW